MKRFRTHTIRFQLTCLVAACVIPVWFIAGFLVVHAYTSKCDEVNRNMLGAARAMTMVVDRDLASVQAALVALATSPAFDRADFRAIHQQTQELLKSYPGADIIVADGTGQQVVNSFRPFGTPLPKRNNPGTVQRIFQYGTPVVSNLFYGAVTKRPLIGIDVPVQRDGKVIYDLAMTFSSERVAATLAREKLSADWYGSILDGKRVVVARTVAPERYVGRQAPVPLCRTIAKVVEGTTELVSCEGTTDFVAFSRSGFSSWTVMIGVPKATVMRETYLWLSWAVVIATTISLVGVILALRFARTIAQDIQALVHPALSIGRGEAVQPAGSHSVRETAEVAQALAQAATLLQRQGKERDRAERELSLTVDVLRKETAERLRAMEELREKDRMLIQQSRLAAMGEMIGNIAHQWRQPLNALGLCVQQVPLYHDLGVLDREFLENNVGSCMELIQHMSRTIDDFRNFFKPDKERVEFRVLEVVEKTLLLLEGSFKSQQIAVEIARRCDPVVNGFPNEYSQVLLNILTNAKDAFAERGVEDPKVVIAIDRVEERTVVTIADNAGGIPEAIIGKIFEPYFTTKGPQAGTGVGLFMSKSIIEKNMGGTLAVRNTTAGAEFRIEV